ncbi:MAG: hypothetical protein HDT43_07350 [Ruminococcaceae bacterium]|nr:hypothetical protein [Oscillospiraceae bacterium]
MALISCPECGKQMSDKAPNCPHCGAPLHFEQPVYTQPASPAVAYDEQFENVIVKGKKSPTGRIVCTVIACLLWLAAAAAIGCVIYDYSFAASAGGINYYGDNPSYYSILAGGGYYIEQYWLIIVMAAAVVLALIGAVIFIAGLGERVKVTNARVIIKRPFATTVSITLDKIETAAKETDTSFVLKSGERKYSIKNLKNQEEVFGVLADMLSNKNTLKMPAVYGVRSVIGKLLRKKTAVICAAAAVVVVIAAVGLAPLIMNLAAQEVANVEYEWKVRDLMYNGLNSPPSVIERTIKGTYSGGWLNGKPYGTGRMTFDNNYPFVYDSNTYTGTWKNGEPCEGTMSYEYSENTYEKYVGGFRYSRPHGQGKHTAIHSVGEGEFRYGSLFNGTRTGSDGTVEIYKNGKCVD